MSVERTIQVMLEPDEMAKLFCAMFDTEQAEFFSHVHKITSKWPGAGWCQQSCGIAENLTPEGREVIRTLAGHVLDG